MAVERNRVCNRVAGVALGEEDDIGTIHAVGALSLGQVIEYSAQLLGITSLGGVVEDSAVVVGD